MRKHCRRDGAERAGKMFLPMTARQIVAYIRILVLLQLEAGSELCHDRTTEVITQLHAIMLEDIRSTTLQIMLANRSSTEPFNLMPGL